MKSNLDNEKFWSRFAKLHWEKKNLLVQDFKSPLREIDENEIYLMLVEFSNLCRKRKSSEGFKFYVDGQKLYEDEVLQFLPIAKDGSLKNYHLRMEKMFSDYCLVCDELLQVSQKNWSRLQSFTRNLYSHVGLPNRFSELGLYLGNYRKTPFGVHVDGCGVFSFPVVGKKAFRLWPSEFGKNHPSLDRSQRYASFNRFSTTMVAKPGDMTYWPSSAWHIAESDGSFNATWSLGVWVDLHYQQRLEEALSPLLKSKLGPVAEGVTMQIPRLERSGEVCELPKEYLKSISDIQKLSNDELHDAMMKSWMALISAGGFKNSPHAKKERILKSSARLQMSGSDPVLWCDLKSEKKRLYAFRGVVLESSQSQSMLKLINDLNLKKSCVIKDYLRESKKIDLQLLQKLSNAGAFQVVPTPRGI